jgi:hypothetical protein
MEIIVKRKASQFPFLVSGRVGNAIDGLPLR